MLYSPAIVHRGMTTTSTCTKDSILGGTLKSNRAFEFIVARNIAGFRCLAVRIIDVCSLAGTQSSWSELLVGGLPFNLSNSPSAMADAVLSNTQALSVDTTSGASMIGIISAARSVRVSKASIRSRRGRA
jgi:hypothetical protein